MKLRRSVPLLLTALTAGVAGFFAGRMFPAAGETAGPGKGAKVVPLAARESSLAAAGPAADKGAAQALNPQAARVLSGLDQWLGSKGPYPFHISDELGQWLAECPSDAIGFLLESPRRGELLRWAASNWASKDMKGISEWLGTAGDFEGRDAIVTGMASRLADDDREAACAWIASIKDPAQRLIAAQEAVYWFYRHSDEAAREALHKMGLPDSSAKSLLEGGVRRVYLELMNTRAQNLIREYDGARGEGADFTGKSASEVLALLNKGVTGSRGRIYMVDSTDWTTREIEDTLKRLEASEGWVR